MEYVGVSGPGKSIPRRGNSSAEALLVGGSVYGVEKKGLVGRQEQWERRPQRAGPVLQGLVAFTLSEMGDARGF